MKKVKKRKASNPVAKNASKFNRATVFKDKTKHDRKKNKQDEN